MTADDDWLVDGNKCPEGVYECRSSAELVRLREELATERAINAELAQAVDSARRVIEARDAVIQRVEALPAKWRGTMDDECWQCIEELEQALSTAPRSPTT